MVFKIYLKWINHIVVKECQKFPPTRNESKYFAKAVKIFHRIEQQTQSCNNFLSEEDFDGNDGSLEARDQLQDQIEKLEYFAHHKSCMYQISYNVLDISYKFEPTPNPSLYIFYRLLKCEIDNRRWVQICGEIKSEGGLCEKIISRFCLNLHGGSTKINWGKILKFE